MFSFPFAGVMFNVVTGQGYYYERILFKKKERVSPTTILVVILSQVNADDGFACDIRRLDVSDKMLA